jgi:hypothetical protein
MDPQQPSNQQQPEGQKPMFNEPFRPPVSPVVVASGDGGVTPPPVMPVQTSRGKLFIGLVIVSIIELLLILSLAVVVATTHKPAAQTSDNSSDKNLTNSAATSTTTQFSSDSIMQDISSLNDDKDFPQDKLSDEALNL